MNFQNILITLLLFLFSAFLFPQMNAAVEAYTGALQGFVYQLPLVWIASVLVVLGYEVLEGVKG